ncbi:MAG: bifunctional nuclease family protein [Gemmatimonadaceae bacterium]
MVEVSVSRLGLDGSSNTYVVVLRENDGERVLPIWIGQAEAESILLQINSVPRERPLTHDLCKTLILGLGGELRKVHITKVSNGTYFAEMHIARADGLVTIDARPSDSIAVALRCGAPILAEESLLITPGDESDDDDEGGGGGEGQVIPPKPDVMSTLEMTAEQLKDHLANLRPEDFGKFKP